MTGFTEEQRQVVIERRKVYVDRINDAYPWMSETQVFRYLLTIGLMCTDDKDGNPLTPWEGEERLARNFDDLISLPDNQIKDMLAIAEEEGA